MKPWKIVVIPTAIMLIIAGIYMFSVWKKRQNPGVQQVQEQKLTPDDVAVVRMQFPSHFDDLKDEEGKSLWMKNGTPCRTSRTRAARSISRRRVGVIPPLQKLDIKKAIKVAVPADIDDGISHGTARRCTSSPSPMTRMRSRSMPHPWARWKALRSSITAICSISMTIPTRFIPTGPTMCGPRSKRTRQSQG